MSAIGGQLSLYLYIYTMLRIAHNKYKQENKREKEWEKERGKEEREMSHGRQADDEHKKGATQEGDGGDPLSAALLTKAT